MSTTEGVFGDWQRRMASLVSERKAEFEAMAVTTS